MIDEGWTHTCASPPERWPPGSVTFSYGVRCAAREPGAVRVAAATFG